MIAKEVKNLFDTPKEELADATQNILQNTVKYTDYIQEMLDKYPALRLVIDIGLFLDIGREEAVQMVMCRRGRLRNLAEERDE